MSDLSVDVLRGLLADLIQERNEPEATLLWSLLMRCRPRVVHRRYVTNRECALIGARAFRTRGNGGLRFGLRHAGATTARSLPAAVLRAEPQLTERRRGG